MDELNPSPAQPSAQALLSLLAYVASSDGDLHDRELDLLERCFPRVGREKLREEASSHRKATELELLPIADQFQTADQRWLGLRFSARMAWKDGALDDAERVLLEKIASAMQLPAGAVARVVREMQPDRGERFSTERVLRVVQEVRWDAVQLASGKLVSEDLAALVPADSEVVARIGIDRVEVMGIATDGVVARFLDGAAFLAWNDLVSYSRDGGLGSGVRLTTEDGRNYVLVDTRLAGLCVVLDRLFDDRERARRTAPVFERVRGE
jgi:hypothetical protein